ncbi:ferric reductase-like transmembrane domain-containing protein [Halomonas sp. ML-15]|nr:ferric reductase-like transmembrane domain-containing protein [Halomonas sp. ML-15]
MGVMLFRLLVLLAGSLPGAWLLYQWWWGDLGPVPAESVVHMTGRTGLVLLLATIAFSPAFRLTRWVGFMVARRQIGLWAFAWLLLHALAWMGLDQYWDWPWIRREMVDLPYVRFGLAGLLLLIPLALTSPAAVRHAMGARAWHWLHRLVYVAAGLGVMHFWVLTRADYLWPGVALAVLMALCVFRLVDAWRYRQ